jgi:hypothetical protein
MKKISLLFLSLFVAVISFAQRTAVYYPTSAYHRSADSRWEWVKVTGTSDELPKIVFYFNNSSDAFSSLDRIEINNQWQDVFIFPYKGVVTDDGKGIQFTVFDKESKKLKIEIYFYDNPVKHFDLYIRYNNIEYTYRVLQNN